MSLFKNIILYGKSYYPQKAMSKADDLAYYLVKNIGNGWLELTEINNKNGVILKTIDAEFSKSTKPEDVEKSIKRWAKARTVHHYRSVVKKIGSKFFIKVIITDEANKSLKANAGFRDRFRSLLLLRSGIPSVDQNIIVRLGGLLDDVSNRIGESGYFSDTNVRLNEPIKEEIDNLMNNAIINSIQHANLIKELRTGTPISFGAILFGIIKKL